MKKVNFILQILIVLSLFTGYMLARDGRKFIELRKFNCPEARQGVAVDENFIYVIDTKEIAKYDKKNGKFISKWQQNENGKIIHLDGGVIIDGKLYCPHSNYPVVPMTSSVEIWDTKTLKHIGTHSFGINWGSCTWIDKHDGYWWAVFGHYNKWKDESKTDVRWTTLIKFDDKWQMLESWVFPEEVLTRFGIMTNSGGSWGPDGYLYCTGHDASELYVLKFPDAGSILELVEIVPINNTGQGIAWDRSDPQSIYTINKSERQVIHSKLENK